MVTLIVGTNRPGSNTRRVAAHIEGVHQRLGKPLAVIDLHDLPPEIFHPSAYGQKPAAFAAFADKVLDADGLIVVTPEYNGSAPGVLKYFIDMLPFPDSFQSRPVAFVGLGAGEWGGLRAVEQLQGIFGYRNALQFPERIFIKHVHQVLDEQGEITDADLVERLARQSEGFLKFVEAVRPLRAPRR